MTDDDLTVILYTVLYCDMDTVQFSIFHSENATPRIEEVNWNNPRTRAEHDRETWEESDCGNGAVVHSYEGHFEETLVAGTGGAAKYGLFVFFYAPWCPHSKAASLGSCEAHRAHDGPGRS